MAQREAKKKEEMELQVSATLTLCANNCGFYGNPATKNLCQSCFKASLAAPRPQPPASSSGGEGKAGSGLIRSPEAEERKEKEGEGEAAAAAVAAKGSREVNRCFGCRRKVGLVGFRCRCGEVFCGEHRYSDRHDCSYDYKAAGRAAIERENPVVRPAKIVRV